MFGVFQKEENMKYEQGFTLIELLVAMTISLVVMSTIYIAYSSQQKAHKVTEEVTRMQQNLRVALIFLEKDIRMAGYDPTDSEAFGFTSPLLTSVQFTSDNVTENGSLDTKETYTYAFDTDNNTLDRKTNTNFITIAEHISGVTIFYFDKDGNATTTADEVRSVNITLSGSNDGHEKTVQTIINCRNIGL